MAQTTLTQTGVFTEETKDSLNTMIAELYAGGTSETMVTPIISGGLTATGSGSNDFSGSTGTFKTSTGANTLGGAVTINDAATPSLTTAAGKTNTGFVLINGKTSGSLKIIAADAAAQAVTVSLAAQTSGAATLTIPDMAGVSKTVAWLESPTFTTPVLGVATATSVNKVALTAPATSATLTIADGKTLTATHSLTLAGTDATTMTFPGASASIVSGVGLYKIARGASNQAAATDTVATGLSTVVACAVTPVNVTVKQLWFTGDVGDQAGTPAAGSILRKSFKPTAVDNCTPTAATDFSDNISVNWVAVGT